MIEWIRYHMLMRRLRGEISRTVNGERNAMPAEKTKTAVVTACKACGSIV